MGEVPTTILEVILVDPTIILEVIPVDPTTILVHQGQGTSDLIQFLTETANAEIVQHPVVAQIIIAIVMLLCTAIMIAIALDNRNVAHVVEIALTKFANNLLSGTMDKINEI